MRPKKPEDHGGPHLPLYRRGQEDQQLLQEDTFGKMYYYDSIRVNLGLFQHDVNVVWDLAPHDLSIMDYLIEEKPRQSSHRSETSQRL